MKLNKNRGVSSAPLLAVILAAALSLGTIHVETLPLASAAQDSGVVEGLMASTPVLSYQGRLLDAATGNPKPDGSYVMSFRLYDVATLGSPLWTETKPVIVGGGLFTTLLGDTGGLNLTIFDGRDVMAGRDCRRRS